MSVAMVTEMRVEDNKIETGGAVGVREQGGGRAGGGWGRRRRRRRVFVFVFFTRER